MGTIRYAGLWAWIMVCTTLPLAAKPIGGYAHSASNSKTIAWDSTLGIAILAGCGIIVLVIAVIIIRALKKRKG